MQHKLSVSAANFFIACGLAASQASATFHQWQLGEVYSDASGNIQFVELQMASFVFDDERFIGGHSLTETSFGRNFVLPSHVPSAPAADSHFLIATPGYAALSGVPAADYVLPVNNWFNRGGDTLDFASVSSLTFTGAQMPSGDQSLNRAYGASALTVAANSPTNFAGVTGTVNSAVPEPTTMLALAAGGVVAARRRRSV